MKPTVHYNGLIGGIQSFLRNYAYSQAFDEASQQDVFRGNNPEGLSDRINRAFAGGGDICVILMESGELARAVARPSGARYDEAELIGDDNPRRKVEEGLPPGLMLNYTARDAVYHPKLDHPVAALIIEDTTKFLGDVAQIAEAAKRISIGEPRKDGATLIDKTLQGERLPE